MVAREEGREEEIEGGRMTMAGERGRLRERRGGCNKGREEREGEQGKESCGEDGGEACV